MKIRINGKPRHACNIPVLCLDSIMLELLNCAPDTRVFISKQDFLTKRETPNFHFPSGGVYLFCSGATLHFAMTVNEFCIQSYLPDGTDAEAAIEELKMLESIREAKRHHTRMANACRNPVLSSTTLRATRS